MNHKYIPPIQTRFLDFRLVCSANCLITVSTRMPNQYHTLNMTKKKKNCLLYICSTSNLCCTFPISENNCSNLLTLEPVLTAFFPCISPPPHPFPSPSNPSANTVSMHFFSFCSFYSAFRSKVPFSLAKLSQKLPSQSLHCPSVSLFSTQRMK